MRSVNGRSRESDEKSKDKDGKKCLRRLKDRHIRGAGERTTAFETVWDAVNAQKHNLCAPKHSYVDAVNELIAQRAEDCDVAGDTPLQADQSGL